MEEEENVAGIESDTGIMCFMCGNPIRWNRKQNQFVHECEQQKAEV